MPPVSCPYRRRRLAQDLFQYRAAAAYADDGLLGTLNFNIAAGTTASVILLASRDSITLSILLLNHVMAANREMAAAISIIIGSITLITALIAREWGRRLTVGHG